MISTRWDGLSTTFSHDDIPLLAVREQAESDSTGLGAVPLQIERTGNLFTLTARLPDHGQGMGAQARLEHFLAAPRHIWMPHIAPEPGFVIGDHAFRSPAILLADERIALVLIPDVGDVETARRGGLRVWLDYDHPARIVTVAAGNYEVGGFTSGTTPSPWSISGSRCRCGST